MTTPLGEQGAYGARRFYQPARGTADASGNLTLQFPPVPAGYVWSGTLFLSSPQPAAIAQLLVRRNDGQYIGSFTGEGALEGVQVADGDFLKLTCTLMGASAAVEVVFIGRIDPIASAPLLVPSVSGPVGVQQVTSSTLFPIVTQDGGIPSLLTASAVHISPNTSPATILTASGAGRLWNVQLSFAFAASTAAAVFGGIYASVRNLTSSAIYAIEELSVNAPSQALSSSDSVALSGMPFASGDVIQLDVNNAAAVAGLVLRAAAVITYSIP